MAIWIKLATRGTKSSSVMVNMDQVAFMQEFEGYTILHFGTAQADGHLTWTVSETMDEIDRRREYAAGP